MIEQQSYDVIGRDEGSIFIQNAKAVGVTVGGDADVRGLGFHRCAQIAQRMVIRFGGMPAKKHIACIVYRKDLDACRA